MGSEKSVITTPESTAERVEAPALTAPTVVGAVELPAHEALAAGDQVGRYRIIEVLGAGAMGMVYRAHDSQLARDVALKLLHPHQQTLPDAIAHQDRLLREAQALARLSHPNVVAAYDVGAYHGAVFIAMELVAGVSLQAWMRTPRSRAEVLRVLVGAGRGLAAAHAAGVVHRDFKPENVMVSADGRPRVVDFGLARGENAPAEELPPEVESTQQSASSSLLTSDLTLTGVLMGTPGYMAPEALYRTDNDPRGDQFGFAATAFRLLTGQKPYAAEDLDRYRRAILLGERTPWPSAVPRSLRRIVDRGLALRPEDRYPSLDLLVNHLERAGRSRSWRTTLGVAALALVSAAIAAWLFRAPARPLVSCDQATNGLDGVWDQSRRAEVERAFAATGLARASANFTLVAERLEDHAGHWRTMREEACRATHVQGEQSEVVLALRYGCLDRSRAQLATLVDSLAHADLALVDQGSVAAAGLDSLDACADVAALLGDAEQMPTDPSRRALVADIDTTLAAASALRLAGRYDEALPRARDALDRARVVDVPLSVAQATLELARVLGSIGNRDDALAAQHEALVAATRAKHPLLIALTSAMLLHSAIQDDRTSDAEAMLPLVESAIQQAGDPGAARLVVLRDDAVILASHGTYPAALAQLAAAQELCKTLPAEHARDCNSVSQERALVLLDMGDPAGAAREHERHLADTRALYGDQHPVMLNEYNNLATALQESGDFASARAAVAESRRLAALHPTVVGALYVPFIEGSGWESAGDCARGLPFYREALAGFAPRFTADSHQITVLNQRLGRCLAATDATAEAIPYLEQWLETRRAQDARPGWQGEARFALAQARWTLGQHREALELAREALRQYRADREQDTSIEVGEIEAWLATHR